MFPTCNVIQPHAAARRGLLWGVRNIATARSGRQGRLFATTRRTTNLGPDDHPKRIASGGGGGGVCVFGGGTFWERSSTVVEREEKRRLGRRPSCCPVPCQHSLPASPVKQEHAVLVVARRAKLWLSTSGGACTCSGRLHQSSPLRVPRAAPRPKRPNDRRTSSSAALLPTASGFRSGVSC